MTLYCDNTSAINISKNLVQYFRTKNIDIHHHFIRDLVENKTTFLEHVEIEKQLGNIFTKTLDFVKFDYPRKALGICAIKYFFSPCIFVAGQVFTK